MRSFPVIFIDEAQDTKKEIWELLNKIYEKPLYNSFYQAYGDSNQAIYNSYEKMEDVEYFPRANALQMLNSKRFGAEIAKLHRRTVRVIWYKENSRLDAIREKEFRAGYAFSHEEIVQYIMTIIPQEEVIVEATRKSVVSFPEIAIRELLANAMIHQDLQQRGTNPMVEVFKNRIEFSNAGAPLVAIERIVDSVPVSRNENIAGFMHKCGICEERGSGYDKIVEATGKNELLAPRIENQNNQFTKAILFAKVPFELTTKEDRMRTCYMQACLAYVNFEGISNSDIRKIFGLGEKEKAKASRLLTSAVDGGYIKVMDPDTAPRYKKYIPYWA